jgi:hypothetical protein
VSSRHARPSNRRPSQPSNRKKPPRASVPEQKWWRRKPVIWAGGVGTVVIGGALAIVLGGVLTGATQRFIPSPTQTIALAPPNLPKVNAASKHHSKRKPSPSPSPTPTTPPLSVASEDPLNLDFLGVWTFPNKIPFSSSQLAHANALMHQTLLTGMSNYFYSLGGYSMNTDTQLVLQNDSDEPVSILDMRIIKDCGPPLTGTLFYSPPAGGDDDVRIGFDLDSADTEAESAKGWDIRGWKPGYFEAKHISFRPGEQRVLTIRTLTVKHACTFSYQATVLEGKIKFYQTLDNSGQPFRVSALWQKGPLKDFDPKFSAYAALYIGGVASPPGHNDDFVRANPRTYH